MLCFCLTPFVSCVAFYILHAQHSVAVDVVSILHMQYTSQNIQTVCVHTVMHMYILCERNRFLKLYISSTCLRCEDVYQLN